MFQHDDEYIALSAAVEEAERFLAKAGPLIEIFAEAQANGEWIYRCHERAAAQRSSLDLTKALARFRKP